MKKVIIFGVNLNKRHLNFEDQCEELENLCHACDFEVIGSIYQNLKEIERMSYFKKGKIEEFRNLIDQLDCHTIVCLHELTGQQIRKLENRLEVEIIDRTGLILNIFEKRARSKEAILQVKIAKLQYQLPRLVNARTNLEKQRGGGVNNRGEGETKLELDHRKIKNEMTMLKAELEETINHRQLLRKKRTKNDVKKVALVGYTNAGKSTLLNHLLDKFHASADKRVFEKNMLFATLDAYVRKVELNNYQHFLLVDTVGFVNDLPPNLVKAFNSTLEEVLEADLLVHVIDASNEHYQYQRQVTLDTLKIIGGDHIDCIEVYNKCDLKHVETNELMISAKTGYQIDYLIEEIKNHIFEQLVEYTLLIPYSESKVVSYLIEHHNVIQTDYLDDATKIKVKLSNLDAIKYQIYITNED